MMAQPAIALGVPLRLLAEADGVSAAQVIPDQLVGDYRDLATLQQVTEGCAVVTFDHEHVPTEHLHALEDAGVACRPGPEALVHAQDKIVMREAMAAARCCPSRGGRDRRVGRRTSRRSACRACSRSAAAATTARACGSSAPPTTSPSRSPSRSAPASGCWPRSWSTSGASSPRWWRARRAARRRRTRSSPRTQLDGICHEVIAPAPDLDPALAGEAQQLALRVAGELGVTGILAVELFETVGRPDPRQRARDAAAQHRSLVAGRRRHLPVREPPARRARPPARLARRRAPGGR